MLAIAHRTPRTAADCQRLADSGAAAFEIDLQFIGAFGALPSTGKATVGLMWHIH